MSNKIIFLKESNYDSLNFHLKKIISELSDAQNDSENLTKEFVQNLLREAHNCKEYLAETSGFIVV